MFLVHTKAFGVVKKKHLVHHKTIVRVAAQAKNVCGSSLPNPNASVIGTWIATSWISTWSMTQ